MRSLDMLKLRFDHRNTADPARQRSVANLGSPTCPNTLSNSTISVLESGPMPRLYVYSRVRTLRQMTGHGLTGQDEARERWLADNQKKYDLELVEDYRDLGISGRGKNVTEKGKMGLILDGIESGRYPNWIMAGGGQLDRISRDELIEAHYLVSGIIRAGIIIVTIADGMIFDRSEKEKMMFNLLISLVTLARSSNESEAKSFRGLRNWVAKRAEAETGKPMTAMTPAWIDLDEFGCLVLNQHAETVRAILSLRGRDLAPR